jgi:hypothetical protein
MCAYGPIRLIRLLLFRCIRESSALLYFIYCRKIKRHSTILILGNTYSYFDTIKTCHGQQTVEIPIVMEMVRKYHGKNMLEIGNVLKHHVKFELDILDKYDIVEGVTNVDVVDFRSGLTDSIDKTQATPVRTCCHLLHLHP